MKRKRREEGKGRTARPREEFAARQDNTMAQTQAQKAQQDRTRQDNTRQHKARQDKLEKRQDKTRQDKTRQDKARQGKTRQGKTCQNHDTTTRRCKRGTDINESDVELNSPERVARHEMFCKSPHSLLLPEGVNEDCVCARKEPAHQHLEKC